MLVVDDSPSILEYVSVTLRQEFKINKVTTLTSSIAALQRLESKADINLIFLDLNMPEMDGIQFLTRLANLKYRGFLVIMSGIAPRIVSSVESLAKKHKLNFVGTILKPLSEKEFQRLFDKITTSPAKPPIPHRLKIYEIIRAIKSDHIHVLYQPQVNLHTREVVGVETLVRIEHPRLGMVSPEAFIDKIDQSELIEHVTFLVLEQTIKDWLVWSEKVQNLKVSVNVTPYLLQLPLFVNNLFNLIEKYPFPVECLCLEITESSLAENTRQELESLSRLNMKGVELALDDFGQDHASIERLQSLPINVLKLDKSIFLDRTGTHGQIAIIESSMAFARRLNMQVVAEGVETAEHWHLADKLGCDVAQGYYLSKPIEAREILPWIELWHQGVH